MHDGNHIDDGNERTPANSDPHIGEWRDADKVVRVGSTVREPATDGGENRSQTQEPDPDDEPSAIEVAGAVLAGDYDPGAGFVLIGAGMRRHPGGVNCWAIYDGDTLVDFVNADRFRSAIQLLDYIETVLDSDRQFGDETELGDSNSRWAH